MSDKVTLSYIAGFWEGEGNAGNYGNGYHHGKHLRRLEVDIAQKGLEALCWLKEFFGYGRIKPLHGVFIWRVRNQNARDFLERIYPYLKFRKEQVAMLIA